MPLRVFPVAAAGSPHYADDFGYVRPGATKGHQGIDIFATQGADVLAPDDGAVTLTTDPKGGQVFYLKASDGVTYYGAHLSSYEGTSRTVAAGDVIGHVGTTGNAVATSPHLHFEVHPGGGAAIDPYPELFAVGASFASSGTPGTAHSPDVLPLAAQAVLAAWAAKHPGAAAPASLAYVLGWAIAPEGSFSAPYQGTNNFGSYHATAGFAKKHAADRGYGMVAFLDHDPAPLIVRMRVYPSRLAGARDYLDLVESMQGDLTTVADATDYVTRLYAGGYFWGFHSPHTDTATMRAAEKAGTLASVLSDADRANIADGVSAMATSRAQAAIAAAASLTTDPDAITVGPPFAPLALRLTPGKGKGYEPHTLDHARELLGARAYNPPAGAISLDDALATPGKDGVWLFGGAVEPAPPPAPSPTNRTLVALAASLAAGLATAAGLHFGLRGV